MQVDAVRDVGGKPKDGEGKFGKHGKGTTSAIQIPQTIPLFPW